MERKIVGGQKISPRPAIDMNEPIQYFSAYL